MASPREREIPTDAELRRCPACNAGNVFLTHSTENVDARRHIECRICSMRGPIKTSITATIEAWNNLPRRQYRFSVGETREFDTGVDYTIDVFERFDSKIRVADSEELRDRILELLKNNPGD